MARIRALVATGFVVGALDAADQRHEWAVGKAAELAAPVLTYEAVISEACFQLRRIAGARRQLMAWIKSSGMEVLPVLPAELDPIATLLDRYDVRMDYADACLVRLSELHRKHVIVTTDAKDFQVYRRFRRERLLLVTP